MKQTEQQALDVVAKRYAATWKADAGGAGARLQLGGKRIAVQSISFANATEPRLRFDRVVVWLVAHLQTALSDYVPDGKTVVTTVTAPIRQASKTAAALEEKVRRLLARRRSQLDTVIHGNRVRVHLFKGGGNGIPKLVGFVHNPEPQPQLLFDMTRSLLARVESGKRSRASACWLIIANQNGAAPLRTFGHVCAALRASTIFKRILVVDRKGVSVPLRVGAR